MLRHLWIIPLLPFAGAAVLGFGGRRLERRAIPWIACGSVGLAFVLSCLAARALTGDLAGLAGDARLAVDPAARRVVVQLADWITVGGAGGVSVAWSFLLDPLSALMILVVTGVGCLIHLYSVGYMAQEEHGTARYFCFLNLFTGMMLLLVLGASLPVLFVGWEGVGLCSYLLIGFYYTEDWCADAGRKAFLVNRIGDAGFLLGALTLWTAAGSFDLGGLLGRAAAGGIAREAALAGSLLLFAGAVGKSAQIPLYVWLPDAMAGPTPVSALIHAATMVTAGVYLVVRLGVVFAVHPLALSVVAGIGAATAVYAATIGCAQTDIKKVLAYSTISQLGYMFVGAGVGAFTAAIFHLMTHAFFKALLFLGAGCVIHALGGVQEMGRMGGLRERLPIPYACMMAGGLAIAGVVPFAGFFSKDEILWGAWQSGHRLIWFVLLLGAGLTAFYIFRLIYLVFHGEPRDPGLAAHAHEAPRVMTWPLVALAFLALTGGWVGVPGVLSLGGDWNRIGRWLAPALPPVHAAAHGAAHGPPGELLAMALGLIAAGAGIGLAWAFYQSRPGWREAWARRMAPLVGLAAESYRVDEAYERFILRPYAAACHSLRTFDARGVDATVNAVAWTVDVLGHFGRYLQTGFVRNYALFLLIGAVLILYWVLP